MIPAIGIMVGFYITVQMLVVLGRTGERAESKGARGLAAITLIVVAVVLLFLAMGGA